MEKLWVFAGRSNEPLAEKIAEYVQRKIAIAGDYRKAPFLNKVFGGLDPRKNFNDGEIYVRYGENIRGADIFIVQSTNQPHENLMELFIMIHTARLASAGRITAIIPYFGYARQDWKDKSRAPITASLIPRLLEAAGVDRVVLLDTHSNGISNAFAALNVQSDHLWARPTLVKYLRMLKEQCTLSDREFAVAAPDLHAVKLARAYAENLGNLPLVVVEKRRPKPGETKVLNIIGEVNGKDVLIVDDMIDTAKTMFSAADALKERGAEKIYALGTHGIFSGSALPDLTASRIEMMFVTDSIRQKLLPNPRLTVVSIAELLGEAIYRIHKNESVSSLFEDN